MSSPDTKNQLIDAAEQVFARDGFAAASLREIMRDAQANPAAVHYHFGGKEGLLEAVLDRVVEPITRRRLELLEDLVAHHDAEPVPTRALVDSFLRPDFEAIESLQRRGPGRARLVGHAYAQPDETVRKIIGRQFDPVGAAYFPQFFRSIPNVDPDVLQWRLRWCVVGVIVTMFGNADEADGPLDATDIESSLGRVVDFLTAGLQTPST